MGLQNVLEQSDIQKGVASLNGTVSVEDLTSLWSVTPGDEFTDLQTFDVVNAWDETAGASVSLQNGLNVLETDGTQADSRVALSTAPFGIYRAGTQVRVAGGFTGQAEPQGDQFYEWGYGRAVGDSFVRFRQTADDLQVRFSNEVSGEKVVSRAAGDLEPGGKVPIEDSNGNVVARCYGLDAMDGTGPSGVDYSPTEGVLSGFLIGWYGPTVTVPFMSEVADIAGEYRERVNPLCLLEPIGEPLFSRPNEPWTWIANNNGTAPGTGEGLRLDTGGRQFSYGGTIEATRRDIAHQSPILNPDFTTGGSTVELQEAGGPTRTWKVLGAFKRSPTDEETAISLGDITMTSNVNLYAHARVIPESDITGTLEYSEPTDTHGESSYFQVDMWADTPSRLSVDTATIDGRTRLKGKSWGGRIVSGSGSPNSFTVGGANEFGLQFVRDNPVVLLGTPVNPSNTSAEVGANVRVPGVQ